MKHNIATLLFLGAIAIMQIGDLNSLRAQPVSNSEPELFVIVQHRRFGYIDATGRIVIPPRFDWAFPFSEGLASVVIANPRAKGTAFIDRTGRIVFGPVNGSAAGFSNGVVRILFNANYAFLDKRGRQVSRFYQSAEDCREGLCAVRMDSLGPKHWGYMNTSGVEVIKGQYDWASPFIDGIARVSIMIGDPNLKGAPSEDIRSGYIDATGKPITELKFEKAWDFSEGLAQVRVNGHWGYIDRTGTIVIATRYEETLAFHEGLAGARLGGKWGFIDKKGEWVIRPEFDSVNNFSEGFASAKKEGHVLVINRTGEIVFSPPYTYVSEFRHGLAVFRQNSRAGVVDKAGKIILQAQYDEIEVMNGLIRFENKNQGLGYANHQGKLVWAPTY